jgi:ssDNA-binding Zn-finger/Zn-ribbon topoisomerase 1
MAKKTDLKCPWCGEMLPTATVKTIHKKNESGTVVERRCNKCDKVLGAYLEEEGEFFSKMRTF